MCITPLDFTSLWDNEAHADFMSPSGSIAIPKKVLYGALVAMALGALWFSYVTLENRRTANVKEQTAQKAAEDVAKSENPFQSDNPLSQVKVDPLEKTKAILNPFESP